MPLTQKHIDELKQIYKQEFQIDLPDKEAWDIGIRLVSLFRIMVTAEPSQDGTSDQQLNNKPNLLCQKSQSMHVNPPNQKTDRSSR